MKNLNNKKEGNEEKVVKVEKVEKVEKEEEYVPKENLKLER